MSSSELIFNILTGILISIVGVVVLLNSSRSLWFGAIGLLIVVLGFTIIWREYNERGGD
jgi:hypothetical protein